MRLALYEPDIPQNAGTLMRLAACLGAPVDLIEPAGFPSSDRAFRRAGLDYLDHVEIRRHRSFGSFQEWRAAQGLRLVLLTIRGDRRFETFRFEPSDILMVGRESAGVPETVHAAADARLRVPMRSGLRSLNVAVAAAMVMGEAMRQTELWRGLD